MKKIILLALIIFMVSCNEQQKQKIVIHKYEILLSTKDTIYVDARSYYLSSEGIAVFRDSLCREFATINNPIYVREIK